MNWVGVGGTSLDGFHSVFNLEDVPIGASSVRVYSLWTSHNLVPEYCSLLAPKLMVRY